MTEFERILRDHLNAAYEDYRDGELPTPAELDAYRLGAEHAITEAAGLFLVEVAIETERREGEAFLLERVHEEVRTTFALEWERDQRDPGDLRIVDETLERELAVLDAMEDCE